jgi:hypothetical protein
MSGQFGQPQDKTNLFALARNGSAVVQPVASRYTDRAVARLEEGTIASTNKKGNDIIMEKGWKEIKRDKGNEK